MVREENNSLRKEKIFSMSNFNNFPEVWALVNQPLGETTEVYVSVIKNVQ